MELDITRESVGADESIAGATGLMVRRVQVLLVGEVRKTLKRRDAIWEDVTARGRRGWRVKIARARGGGRVVINITNTTAHGTILPRSATVRGRPNPYVGKVHELIAKQWPHIVQRASDRAEAESA